MDINIVSASLEELVRFKKGEVQLKPIVVRAPAVNVKELREQLKLSQEGFAEAFRLSPDTVRGWEQGRREPDGPARTLLALIQRNPQGIREQIERFDMEENLQVGNG